MFLTCVRSSYYLITIVIINCYYYKLLHSMHTQTGETINIMHYIIQKTADIKYSVKFNVCFFHF